MLEGFWFRGAINGSKRLFGARPFSTISFRGVFSSERRFMVQNAFLVQRHSLRISIVSDDPISPSGVCFGGADARFAD